MISFEQLPERPPTWDALIRKFDTKTLFHESAWLDHVQSIHPGGEIVYYAICEGGKTIGYYTALRIRKMMIPIHGSPLGGTGTNFMGPITDKSTNQQELVRGLTRLFRLRHFLHLELSHYWLDRATMERAGFQVQEGVTHLIPLPPTEDEAWGSLKSEARNRVRKAEKNGVVVERTNDPAIVDHFFAQFQEVYGKQGMGVPFGIGRPRSLFEHLFSAGRLLPVWVRQGEEILAAGLFPYDEHCIYFWGAASWLKHQRLCPNEALHWEVIRFAVRSGIGAYNMCGGRSQFKNKFGGEDVPYNIYYKSSIPLLQTARRAYRARHFRRLKTSSDR